MKFLKFIPLLISLCHVAIIAPLLYWFIKTDYQVSFAIFTTIVALTLTNELAGKLLHYWTPATRYLQVISTRVFLTSLVIIFWWYELVSTLLLSCLLVRDFVVLVLVIIMHCQSPVPLYVGNTKLSSRLYLVSILSLELIILTELAFGLVSTYLYAIDFSLLVSGFSYFIMACSVISGLDLILTKLRVTSGAGLFSQ